MRGHGLNVRARNGRASRRQRIEAMRIRPLHIRGDAYLKARPLAAPGPAATGSQQKTQTQGERADSALASQP